MIRLSILFAATVVGTAAASPADPWIAAQQPDLPWAYRNAISVQLATLDQTGGSLLVERALPQHKLSVVLAVGAREAAQGDYDSTTRGAGIELRRWLWRSTSMTGWYVGARTDLARTHVDDKMADRSIGGLTTWTTGLELGRRWVLFHRVELTPSIGTAAVVEGGMHGRSPTTVRGAGVVGLSVGWIFGR
jgi:hypothetical protein